MDRRRFCQLSAGLLAGSQAGCGRDADALSHITGEFTDTAHVRGHLLRDSAAGVPPATAPTRQTQVLILGAGVAGLAAARALRMRGVDDFVVLELEDQAGGNARAATVGGMACPLGAHYLPLPSDDAPEVQDLLEELGLRQRKAGVWRYDERHLCHSPQERLYFQGEWHEGLLPVYGVGPSTLDQYRRFAALVAQARAATAWHLPAQRAPVAPYQRELAAQTFAAYLDRHGLDDVHLRWYLDYCCRDDYGAAAQRVSAWAGIHYFASRHGFHAPGEAPAEREGLLTWPEGNAWLTQRLAAPLGERLQTGRVVMAVVAQRQGVQVDAWNARTGQWERWTAAQVVVALPIFVAARVVHNPPDFLRAALARTAYAPWLVANVHLTAALHDPPGAAPSWDNVIYGVDPALGGGLGYVDASHQSLRPVPGATVLTHYRALGSLSATEDPHKPLGWAGRSLLMQAPWTFWRDTIMAELALAHPDLPAKAQRLEITRYGHAMAIPVPQSDGQIGLWPKQIERDQLSKSEQIRSAYPPRPVLSWERLHFAHSDWAGYSVFEEAFTAGHTAGHAAAITHKR